MLYSVQGTLVISSIESDVELGPKSVAREYGRLRGAGCPPADQTRVSHPNLVPRIWL